MDLLKKLEAILERILSVEPVIPGSLNMNLRQCRKPNCKCMDKENPKKHETYQVTFSKEGCQAKIIFSFDDNYFYRSKT